MYNDHGSLVRDAEECNLNSINFAESSSFASYGGGEEVVIEEKGAKAAELVVEEEEEGRKLKPSSSSSSSAKSELLWIAEYERRGLDTAMSLLASELGRARAT
ncbi:BcDTC1 diterpene cyclase [Apiospora arundinis]|uniref:BcDTC1 diterpene cyclase n=1 Tax=Apiospora arundinis TaxID=335852 RepID=A0ABR2HYX1_9PEZI